MKFYTMPKKRALLHSLNMPLLRFMIIVICIAVQGVGKACTIVAVSGRVTEDGRPLLLKNRDSNSVKTIIKIGSVNDHTYLSQNTVGSNWALSGYNDKGFAIINSHSYNMPNSSDGWNAYIMQLALERCVTVDQFEHLLDSLPKPIPVCSNYGVIDALGHAAIFETSAYTYVKYDADSVDCGYIIRTNFSFSQDTTGVYLITPTSLPRYEIASNYLEDAFATNGCIAKEHLFGLTRCLVDRYGEDLRDIAPYDEQDTMPVEFRNYVPRFTTTSAMIIQGVLPNESPQLTVAWTMLGPPLVSVTVPYLITTRNVLPQKAKPGYHGSSWFAYHGQNLKNICFIDNYTIDLAKLYNLCETGVMQIIDSIEEHILDRGNELVENYREGLATCFDVEYYYSWVDNYVEEQYTQFGLFGTIWDTIEENTQTEEPEEQSMEYYDLMGHPVKDVKDDAIIKKSGNTGIILN